MSSEKPVIPNRKELKKIMQCVNNIKILGQSEFLKEIISKEI